ncbi:major capsid protein [Bergeyella zoohelcum]|uniref:major capsid protein n=1 Tax=Bergeyella zoohelcum TaxID=1015 RepID=UPI003734C583
MKEQSIFGNYAQYLQVLLDTRAERFNKPWYATRFTWDLPQVNLDFTTVLGEAVITAAASIVDRDGETPLRSRDLLAKLTGEIPAIKVMLPLNESQYRSYMSLKNMPNIKDQDKKNAALKLIWDDSKKVVEAVHNRLDMMILQMISTGKLDVNINNNPDGLVIPDIDLLMPSDNKKTATTSWKETTAKPIEDIQTVVRAANEQGKTFEKILIDRAKFIEMMKNKEVRDTLGAFYGLTRNAMASQTAPITLDRLNQYMAGSELPQFEIVDKKVAIEKNGQTSIVTPFEQKNLAFIPAGQLGVIKNALAIEEMNPVDNVSYAKHGRVLVSKWKQNEPWREYTKSECNAMPVVEQINNIFILQTES